MSGFKKLTMQHGDRDVSRGNDGSEGYICTMELWSRSDISPFITKSMTDTPEPNNRLTRKKEIN